MKEISTTEPGTSAARISSVIAKPLCAQPSPFVAKPSNSTASVTFARLDRSSPVAVDTYSAVVSAAITFPEASLNAILSIYKIAGVAPASLPLSVSRDTTI